MREVLYTRNLKDVDGFHITFQALVEYSKYEEDDKKYQRKTLRDIESGKLVYFCAKVTASKCNVDLASDYIGCCVYKSYDEFCDQTDGYITDMINTVVSQAKEKIKELNQ